MKIRWVSRVRIVVTAVLVGTVCGASGLWAENGPPPSLPRATQAWRSVTGQQFLCVAGDRIWLSGSGSVRVLGIERRGPQTWTIRNEDHLKTWKVSQQSETLRTEVAGQVTEYRRLESVPAECGFKDVPIGQAREMSWERRDTISREIHERMQRDEESMKAGIMGPTSPVVIENREYLKSLIQELGWIDRQRFGPEGSGNAIVLAQHSEDLSLMAAILPFVEKDYKGAGESSVMYALLYDALQLHLGRKQRYGTQLGVDSEGRPMVLPLEDASKVEQFRKEIGLPPLAEYLQLASEGLYSGKPIRMPRADE
jgi:hypothetical protein